MRCRRLTMMTALIGLTLAIGQRDIPSNGAEDDLSKELPRIKPLDPAAAVKSFQVHPGFRIEPIAVEPLVTDPVSAAYDADGRLFVVEMRGYPYPEQTPTGNVRLLVD